MKEPSRLAGSRVCIVAVSLALTAIGLLFVHSAKAEPGETFPGVYARSQLAKVLVSVVVFVLVARLDYRRVASWAPLIYGALLAVLTGLVVLRFLDPEAGARYRWIRLPFFRVQPSELMKLALIVALARYLRYREDQRSLLGLTVPYLLVFVPMVLVALQPDLGTSLMFPPVLLALLFVARAKFWPLLTTIVVGVGALPAVYALHRLAGRVPLLHEYQLRRLDGFFRQGDPSILRDSGLQLHYSKVAIGSGGLWGKGLGQGDLNLGRLVPEHHTDFIFSVIGEEWGFVGAAAVLLLFLLLVVACLRIAVQTREPFGRLLATGVGVALAAQTLQNVAMTVGLTPITGLTLPLVSFGGSSLVSSALSLGLVVAVASRRVRVVATADLDPGDLPRVLRVEDPRPAGGLSTRWPV